MVADVSPNFRPHPTTNTTQSEMSIDVHPTDENIVFGSANASNWPVTTIYGTGVYGVMMEVYPGQELITLRLEAMAEILHQQ